MLFCPKISSRDPCFDHMISLYFPRGASRRGQITITKWPRIVKIGTKHSSWRVNPPKTTPYFADKGNPVV